MKFKPFTDRYTHSDKALIDYYPDYLAGPVSNWVRDVLWDSNIWTSTGDIYYEETISSTFLDDLKLSFREDFPRKPEHFLPFVLEEKERITEILNMCLQNYATVDQAAELERVLEIGGSAYAVVTAPDVASYVRGVGQIVQRVPELAREEAEAAMGAEPLLREAWVAFYSRNPDYEKTVIKCCEALEKTWMKYFPTSRPQITKYIRDLRSDPSKLNYKGSSIISPASLLSDLADNFSSIRGQHLSGSGRAPTREEAEFALHFSILVWNLER